MVKQEDIISQVRDRGFCVAHDWLNANDIKRLRSMVTRNGTSKADATGIYTETISGLIKRFYLGIVKLEYSYIQHAFDSAFLIYISRKYGIKRLAKNILGVNNVIGFPDGYISPKSDEFAAHWHVDQAYGGKERIENPVPHNKYFIKFFFYLTDVDTENGCLAYIPNSNIIATALRRLIYEGRLQYRPYWTLKDFRAVVASYDVRPSLEETVDPSLINTFLEDSRFIEEPPHDSSKFDYKSKSGDAVIFDESGVHRGAAPTRRDQIVVRFMYREKLS